MDNVKVSGPLFDGRAEAALSRYIVNCKQKIAQEGVNQVRTHLGEVLKHNEGIYEAHIHTENQADDIIVTDTPIVYGPWLEGVGSRDAPRTRFRGYGTFRYVSQQLNQQAGQLADDYLHEGGYIGEMNQ